MKDVLEFVGDFSGATVAVDWAALEKAKVSRDAPVTLRFIDVPLDQALLLILEAAGGNKAVLDFDVKGDVITVSVEAGTA